MQFKKASLSLLLPLLVAACDSSQPTYSASNANSAPPPAAVEAPAPKPAPPPVAAPAPVAAQAATEPAPAMAPAKPPRPTWRDQTGNDRWTAKAPAGKMGPVEKIGVGSCDDYVERYRTCFNTTNMTREQKAPLRRALADQLRQWKADSDAGRISQVAAACTAADRTARESFRKVGCTSF